MPSTRGLTSASNSGRIGCSCSAMWPFLKLPACCRSNTCCRMSCLQQDSLPACWREKSALLRLDTARLGRCIEDQAQATNMSKLNRQQLVACCKASSEGMKSDAMNSEPVGACSPAGACLLPSCIWHSHDVLQALVQQQKPLQRKPDPDNSSGHSAEDHGAIW